MPDEISPERVRVIAEAARIPLGEGSAERVARAGGPLAARFAAKSPAAPFEAEPSTFNLVQAREKQR